MEGHTITRDELEHRFQNHPADSQNQKDAHDNLHLVLLEATDACVLATGAPSPEQSLAVRKIEEGLFWFKAALDRSDGPRT